MCFGIGKADLALTNPHWAAYRSNRFQPIYSTALDVPRPMPY